MPGVALRKAAGVPVARGGMQVGLARHLPAPEAERRARAAVPLSAVGADGQPAAGLPGGAPVGHVAGGRSDRARGGAGAHLGGGGGEGAPDRGRGAGGERLGAPPPAARAGVSGVAAHARAGPVRVGGPDLGGVRRRARHGGRAGAVADGGGGAPRQAAGPGRLPGRTKPGGRGRAGEEATQNRLGSAQAPL